MGKTTKSMPGFGMRPTDRTMVFVDRRERVRLGSPPNMEAQLNGDIARIASNPLDASDIWTHLNPLTNLDAEPRILNGIHQDGPVFDMDGRTRRDYVFVGSTSTWAG